MLDGHVMVSRKKFTGLHYLAQLEFVQNICETGFNAGHSSFVFLTANPRAVVHTFDAGFHRYTRPMASYMTRTFPGRFHFHLGDAKRQIQIFIRSNPSFRCDLIFVDGGHDITNVFSDLSYLAQVASDTNIIIADGAGDLGIGLAWSKLCNDSVIDEIHCSFKGLPDFRDADFFAGKVITTTNYTIPPMEEMFSLWNSLTKI